MDTKDILKATQSTKRLVQDDNYYKNIFKKTERVVSVVFFVSYSLKTDKKTEALVSDVLSAAQAAHNAILRSLETRSHVAEEVIRDAAHSLIALESKLRVAEVAGQISPEVMHVIGDEIDAVLRGMNRYLADTSAFDDMEYRAVSPSSGSDRQTSRQTIREKNTNTEHTTELDRRERIKTVLEAKGESTIKDIADIITDVSTKTIQRELNSMIEDNIIKRQGERRWSKYSVV